jgi:hypothetical protein
MRAPTSLDVPGGAITVTVGAAIGRYNGMPVSRAYALDVHMPASPASVKVGARALRQFDVTTGDRAARDQARADFAAASDGWYFDAGDRRGVLHVKIPTQKLADAFGVIIGL